MKAEEEAVSIELPAPPAWTKMYLLKGRRTPRKNEIMFIAPTGEEIGSRKQLEQYLRAHPDGPALSEFDWGTGETPRRSARISKKSKATTSPISPSESEPPKKRARRPSSASVLKDTGKAKSLLKKPSVGETAKVAAAMGDESEKGEEQKQEADTEETAPPDAKKDMEAEHCAEETNGTKCLVPGDRVEMNCELEKMRVEDKPVEIEPDVGSLNAKGSEMGPIKDVESNVGLQKNVEHGVGLMEVVGPDVGLIESEGPDQGLMETEGPDALLSKSEGPDVGVSNEGPDLGFTKMEGPDVGLTKTDGPDEGCTKMEGPDMGMVKTEEGNVDCTKTKELDIGPRKAEEGDMGQQKTNERMWGNEEQLQGIISGDDDLQENLLCSPNRKMQ